MQVTSVEEILSNAGYSEPKLMHSGKNWAIWRASYYQPAGRIFQTILYMKSQAGMESVLNAAAYLKTNPIGDDLIVLLENPFSDLYLRKDRVRELTKAIRIISVRELLYGVVKNAIRRSVEIDNDPYFIEQDIIFPDQTKPAPSISSLASWLRGQGEYSQNVAVLLAPAGSGKTTLTRQLFLQFVTKYASTAVPLLVVQKAWEHLADLPTVNLHQVWGSAASAWYPETILGVSQLEQALSVGAVIPIFDGLDELCTILPFEFNPDETVREMLDMFTGEASSGRLLITSRTSFWLENIQPLTQSRILQIELAPFTSKQREAYIKRRHQSPEKIERTNRILSRLAGRIQAFDVGRTSTANMPYNFRTPPYHELQFLPYIVVLAGESADTNRPDVAERFGQQLSSDDPLRGLLLALCDREVIRHRMQATAEEQLKVLEIIATECGDSPSIEDLELAINGVGLPATALAAFLSHGLLDVKSKRVYFLFPFVYDYLRASVLVKWLLGGSPSGARAVLRECAKQPGNLLEACAQLVRSKSAQHSWHVAARTAYTTTQLTTEERVGFLHLMIVTAKQDVVGLHKDVTRIIVTILGNDKDYSLIKVVFSGSIAGLDMTELKFSDCEFSDVEFVKCAFDSRTCFTKCKFNGRLLDDGCKNLGEIELIDCDLSPQAITTFQRAKVRSVASKLTKGQIEAVISDLLGRFTRGPMGFVTRRQDGIRTEARRAAGFGEEVLDFLVKYRVLNEFQSGPRWMYKVENTRDVRQFLDNALKIGTVKDAHDALVTKLGAS
jgi:hypothetical protein